MTQHQAGILADVPSQARHLYFALESQAGIAAALGALSRLADGESLVVGFGESLTKALGVRVEGLRTFPALTGAGVDVPSTQHALWCWLRGEDRGELLHRARELEAALAPALRPVRVTEAFRYGTGRDLTGYEDGTENPEGEDAEAAAIAGAGTDHVAGGSFAAVQHWLHDLDGFAALPVAERDNIIGRRQSDNEELEDAPASAHVKRTATPLRLAAAPRWPLRSQWRHQWRWAWAQALSCRKRPAGSSGPGPTVHASQQFLSHLPRRCG